jgi:hypothetical protein
MILLCFMCQTYLVIIKRMKDIKDTIYYYEKSNMSFINNEIRNKAEIDKSKSANNFMKTTIYFLLT